MVTRPASAPLEKAAHEPSRGAVFTKRWVVDLLLDLAGYDPRQPLAERRALEPACGSGAFLVAMVERLVASCAAHGHDLQDAHDAIEAVDINPSSVSGARRAVVDRLSRGGLEQRAARTLARRWIRRSDFLLPGPEPGRFDFVVGNPPYVRLEQIPSAQSAAYRERWRTMTGRADLYVGFIEAGLDALSPGGVLAFICADRWMRNQYGSRLREKIQAEFAVDAAVTMHGVDAFEDRVAAYPAIVVVRRAAAGPTLVADTTRAFGEQDARDLVAVSRGRTTPRKTRAFTASWTPQLFRGHLSWPTGSGARLESLTALEGRLPALEESGRGTRVGVGLATGRDSVFVTTDPLLVEDERLLPLAVAPDTAAGSFEWSKNLLVNVWDDDGHLVDLRRFARLRAHLEYHDSVLRRRHVAKTRPHEWYRTIDRVRPGLAASPKLLLPDLKTHVHPVLDEGGHYPHHNLFWVTSDQWDLEALGALLLSDLGNAFVEMYSVRMASGCLRVSAQYLRRIRLPHVSTVNARDRRALVSAFRTRDREQATAVALRLVGLSSLPR